VAFLMLTVASTDAKVMVNFDTVEEIAVVALQHTTNALLRFVSGKKLQVEENVGQLIGLLADAGIKTAWKAN
jgi:hypothetical protein